MPQPRTAIPFLQLFLLTLGLALPGASPGAQSVKLSQTSLVRAGHVESFQLSPDGAWVVFPADLSAADDVLRLYSMPSDGSAAPVQLYPSNPSASITPDGGHVVFLASGPSGMTLFGVPIDGSQVARRLDAAGTPITAFQLTPDGSRVAYLRSGEVCIVAVDGSTPPLVLSSALLTVDSVLALTPDSTCLVFRARETAGGPVDLFSVPSDGSAAPRRLNLTRPNGNVQPGFALSFDSLGVVYRADQDADEVYELYGVRVDGAFPPAKRSGALTVGGDVLSFQLSRADDRIVYRADQSTNNVIELYSVRAISGGTPVKLNAALAAGDDVRDFELSPDATRVAYRTGGFAASLFGVRADGSAAAVELAPDLVEVSSDYFIPELLPSIPGRVLWTQATSSGRTLWSAPLDGNGPALQLSPSCLSSPDSGIQEVLRDGTVLHTAAEVDVEDLYRVPIDGSGPSTAFGIPAGVNLARATPDGRVVYQAQSSLFSSQWFELFSVPLAGGRSSRLCEFPLVPPALGWVKSFTLAQDGSRVVYQTEAFYGADLFGAASDGSDAPLQLNDVRTSGLGMQVSPDGAWAVFVRGGRPSTTYLYAVPTDGSAPPVLLSTPPPPCTYAIEMRYVITPDSTRVLYADDAGLHVVPLDGSAPSTLLVPGSSEEFGLSAAGDRVVYYLPATMSLYSAPLDGSAAPVWLALAPGTTGLVAPIAGRVAYLAGGKLHAVPLDGSAPAVLLSGPDLLVSFEPAITRISPDGSWIVFRASRTGEHVQLYSAPLDGSAPVRRLNADPVDNPVFPNFLVSPDSTRVVYMSDQEVDSFRVYDLYSVDIAGGGPVKLVGGLPTHLDSENYSFAFGAAGRVVLCADAASPGVFELFGVPLDGSAPPVRLNAPLPAGGDVDPSFQLTPDGRKAVYLADQSADEQWELFSVALAGNALPRVLNDPLVPYGDVGSPDGVRQGSFQVSSDGERVLYLADQDRDQLFELYATELEFRRWRPLGGRPVPEASR